MSSSFTTNEIEHYFSDCHNRNKFKNIKSRRSKVLLGLDLIDLIYCV